MMTIALKVTSVEIKGNRFMTLSMLINKKNNSERKEQSANKDNHWNTTYRYDL
jgi:hypothetical protein